MLKKLTVQNYALINELQLNFGNRLNIITGETGAGKSVLMGALGLLLGERADTSVLLDRTRKCIIEGEFISSGKVKSFLENNELDADENLIIHREINKDGKTRSFVNDTPVNLSLLREIGNLLVDIHSQHETLLLNQSDFQLSVVDAFSEHSKLLSDYRIVFREYTSLKNKLNQLKEEEAKSRTDLDYLQFQYRELEEARLEPDELGKLENELSVLSHAEEIKINIDKFSNLLNGSENNLLSGLSVATNLIEAAGKYSTNLSDNVKRLKAVIIELKDIGYEIENSTDNLEHNPQRLEFINERLNLIYRLLQKHRLENTENLIQLKNSIGEKIATFNSLEEEIEKKTKDLELIYQKTNNLALKLSENRIKAIPIIESKIRKNLSDLGMPDAVLKVEISNLKDNELNPTGKDQVKFLFSANKGIPYAEISKVASGGELSRLMLCLKSSVAKLIELPTIVFDEIDTGVSGETAFKIGRVMQELSSSHQLISITHLPQIASRGEDHFFVYKEISGKKTVTKVRKLTFDERVVEVARMLSGDKPTAVAMENAKELLAEH